MNTIKFGTDGWRAEIAKNFTFANVKAVAQAIADYVKLRVTSYELRAPKLVVGYDTRFLSDRYAQTVASVLVANDIDVLLTDRPTPTPAVTFAIKNRKLAGGIMITASHNPARFNGLKFKTYEAAPAEADVTRAIENRLFKKKVRELPASELKRCKHLNVEDISGEYTKFIRGYLDMRLLKNSKVRALVDSMHGCANRFIERVLAGTPNSVTTLHPDPDPAFGGVNPEPLDYNLKEMAAAIKIKRYDLGIANDGDADRVAAMKPDGEFISGQLVICLLLLHLVEDRGLRGGVVKSLQSSVLIDKIARKYNLKVFTTPVGFKHISKIIRTEDILLGGEESGGISFKNYIPERDGILSGLLLVEMLAARKKPLNLILDDMIEEFGEHHYSRKDIKLSQGARDGLVKRLEDNPPRRISGRRVVKVTSCGGIKYDMDDDSWLYLRLSGTEPVLRICAEAKGKGAALRLIESGEKLSRNGCKGAH